MSQSSLIGVKVRLSTEDGRTLFFTVADLIPYAGETYVVLCLESDNEQLLITQISAGVNGEPNFNLVTDDDIIERVLEKRVARFIKSSLSSADDPCDSIEHEESNER